MLRSLEQDRARYAWDCVNGVKAETLKKYDKESGLLEKIKEEIKRREREESRIEEKLNNYYKNIEGKYPSYVKKTPTLIQINGLGNTLAFYRSKFGIKEKEEEKLSADDRTYKLLYEHINNWFKKKYNINQDIIEWIISENSSSLDLFKTTREILSLLNWIKRFAEAELKELKGEESG